ncbi:Transcriptional regulator, GntR family [Paraburkholderia caribensis MBA4]|uniref:Transcriptional regulator, GntR family n=1 Tax=Paraburkholderia caribensis MBA4 TaxID=1323664 RepID=A0A0P0RIR0_9BURK|nr:GntR family transcriptional regulator [Paraburkholderia caribensis]ALL68532.1 Transcriptional regulator, GntR family [Paraburkholderia caribensis MBA4]
MPTTIPNETTANTLRLKSSDAVYGQIRAKILDNAFRPGMHAREQDLAEMFGVSRTPVREAMVRLRDEGLVEIVPRRGMRVLPVSVDDMHEIYQILTSLEATAAALVAERKPGAKDLQPFERACVAMDRALAKDDLEAWAEADEAFHLHLLKLCGNTRLEQIVRKYWDQIHRVRYITLKLGPKPHASAGEHREILEALSRGDANMAQQLFRQHRARGVQKQLDTLKEFHLDQV